MRYCTHCGKQIDDDAFVCIYCGREVSHEKKESGEPRIKYCPHCGAAINEGADVCLSCGRRIERGPTASAKTPDATNDTLTTIAKVLMVVTCAACGVVAAISLILTLCCGLGIMAMPHEAWVGMVGASIIGIFAVCALIPLAWTIPLTVYVFKCSKKNAPISTATKICILIFVNLISGILLLCRTEPDQE